MRDDEAEIDFLQLFEQLEIQKKSPKRHFPLLKLPRVVLLECIENLDVFEIILFSLLSKRAKSIAKLLRGNLLDIFLSSPKEEPEIWFKLPNVPGQEWIIDYHNEKESSVYPIFKTFFKGPRTDNCLFLKDNGIEDLKQMVKHICEVFRSPITEIQISEESIIEWIISFQQTVRFAWIDKDVITSIEKLDLILKNLKVTEYFHLESISIDENFQFTEPIPFPSISIENSYWLTLSSILNGNNSIIRLYDSKLTSKDINTILKEWQLGNKLQNLELLTIHTTPLLDYDDVLKDLNWTDGDENDGKPMTIRIHYGRIFQLSEVETVRNLTINDGTILSVFYQDMRLEDDELMTYLTLQVWNRQT